MDNEYDANKTFADLMKTLNMEENSASPVVEEAPKPIENNASDIDAKVQAIFDRVLAEKPAEQQVEQIVEQPKVETPTIQVVTIPVPEGVTIEEPKEEPVEEIVEETSSEAPEKVDVEAIFEKVEKEQQKQRIIRDQTLQKEERPAPVFEEVEEQVEETEDEPVVYEPFDIKAMPEVVGSMFGGFFIKLWLFISTIIIDAYNLIKTFILFLWNKFNQNVILAVKDFRDEWKTYKREQDATNSQIKSDIKRSPRKFFKILRYYVKAFYGRHPQMFSNFVNTVLPIGGFIILVATIVGIKSSTYALEVTSNGVGLGYVENESIYLEAQNLVNDRFSVGDTTSNVADVGATYKIVTVKANDLLDAETVSDNIVESAGTSVTYACGIYIDNEFICALSSETDAMQVFNNILDAYPTEDESDVVGFVEDVQYVQGLYTDDDETIWSADKLAATLGEKKTDSKYYTVQSGDTLSQIAHRYGMTVTQLRVANPDVGDSIYVGQQILVSGETNYLNIKVVKTVVQKETVAFKTIKTNNSKLYKGTTKVKQKGVNGIDSVTYLVTYVNGVKVSSEEVNRVTIKAPVDQKVDVGTKVASGYTASTYKKGSGSLVWPAVGVYKVSSPYGYRTLGGRTRFHSGIDLANGHSAGHTVVAAAAGTVTTAKYSSGYGYYVVINHGGGMSTLYAHMQKGSICVKVGQYVNAGTAIGKIGSTGNSTGNHLHFEVRINGKCVNPAPYIGA